MTPEGKVKAKIKAKLDSIPNLYYYCPPGGAFGRVGTPDFFICYKSMFISVEAKREDGKGQLSKMQEITIKNLKDAGASAFVVGDDDSFKQFFEALEDL